MARDGSGARSAPPGQPSPQQWVALTAIRAILCCIPGWPWWPLEEDEVVALLEGLFPGARVLSQDRIVATELPWQAVAGRGGRSSGRGPARG
jgi:hypothetical protein